MLERIFSSYWIIEEHRTGPLGKYSDVLAVQLIDGGYSHCDLRRKFGVISDLNRWLKRKELEIADLYTERIEEFCKYRKRKTRNFYGSGDHATLQRLITILQNDGILPPRIIRSKWGTEIDRVIAPFQEYLKHEKGFSPSALTGYVDRISRFLKSCFGKRVISLREITASTISRYMLQRAKVWRPKNTQTVASALRTFLRFAFANGDIPTNLSGCILSVPSWRGQHLPEFLTQHEVIKLLRACDKRTKNGIRTYAIILLLVRLGLRASEVLELSLDDINWGKGLVSICGKGSREAILPLPDDVGKALVAYIKQARPKTKIRKVFLTIRAPYRALAHSSSLGSIVCRALLKAKLNPRGKGAHLLRYTAASECLRQGATLSEIGDLLRHRSIDTTAIYAKVDLNRLTTLALPWPAA